MSHVTTGWAVQPRGVIRPVDLDRPRMARFTRPDRLDDVQDVDVAALLASSSPFCGQSRPAAVTVTRRFVDQPHVLPIPGLLACPIPAIWQADRRLRTVI
jgi:hypothetical protein